MASAKDTNSPDLISTGSPLQHCLCRRRAPSHELKPSKTISDPSPP
uniref:Uncharacterized protein n=1 Tax=Arundo donax TaxID=35708 RepID=A0A0A9CFT8_ARUDO